MSSNPLSDILNRIFNKYLFKLIRIIFECLISILFVQLPRLFHLILRLGKSDQKSEKQKRVRAKLVDDSDPSSSYRAVEVIDKLQNQPERKVETLSYIPDLCLQRHPDKETMGVRQILDLQDEKQPNGKIYKKFIMGEYQFTTYREACARIDNIGRGLITIDATIGEKILIYSETRSEWLLTAFAAFRHGFILVTLLPTVGEDALKHVINESEVQTIITSQELIPKLEKILNQTKKVRYVVYFPALAKPEEAKTPKDKNNIQFILLSKLEEQGKNANIVERILNERPQKTDVAVIMYTSGSTGTPKGVSIRHESVVAAMTGQKERVFGMVDVDNDIYIAYLPLAHILELCCEILMFYMGVKSGYSSPQTLTDQSTSIKHGQKGDLEVLRPHLMACVPTILDRIHKTINEKVNQSNIFKRQLFNLAYTIKVKRLESGLDSPFLDRFIFSRFNKMVVGGRVKGMLSGGAALSEDTQRFIQSVLCVTIFQGYGLTETCAAGTIADQFDITSGRVGYPLVSCEIRLINWDEGQYKTTDKPNPRGEILIGGKVVAEGYYGQAEKENENFKEIDGIRYFCTGDIGEVFPDGTLQIVDRKKDLIKLRGGEYVSLTKVETAIQKSSIVENCCVCASSDSEYPVALICPKPKEIETFAEKHFHKKDWKTLVDDDKFNDEILKEIEDACQNGGIEKCERPQRVKVVKDSWTPETGLVTDALKLKRKAIEQKYKDNIEQLYQNKSNKKTDSKENSTEVGKDLSSNNNDNKKDQ